MMAAVDLNLDDLEDGEIESDSEQTEEIPKNVVEPQAAPVYKDFKSKPPSETYLHKFENKREKKSKEHHHKGDRDHKSNKDKNKPYILPTPGEDDYAGNIEKAIRMALKKGADVSNRHPHGNEEMIEEPEVKRKHKKRKKHDQLQKESSKKRKKVDETRTGGDEDMDEDEMMCVRGASPVLRSHSHDEPFEQYNSGDDYESYNSDCSDDGNRGHVQERGGRGTRGRGMGGRDRRPDRMRGRPDRRRQDAHPKQDPDGVCLFFMQGKCYKGDDCTYSHDAHPPRKMELCKFYLMDCCAKRDKCLYLHSDFPCKYYHTGLPCVYKDDCKFAHGKPLTESLRLILLKHIESAPKEILGDFPRLSRDGAASMVANTQIRLLQQYSPSKSDNKDKSVFELNTMKPHESMQDNFSDEQLHNSDKAKMIASKIRQSRWCDSPVGGGSPSLNSPSSDPHAAKKILSVQNLNGVLSTKQISELVKLGIDNLNQLSHLTVKQLNEIGLTMNQINEIQLNTMSIQKLGLIKSNQSSSSNPLFGHVKNNMDLDMRVSPVLQEMSRSPGSTAEIAGKDVDMRFQPTPRPSSPNEMKNSKQETSYSSDPRKKKNSLDIDQYTKDALKFSHSDKDNTVDENVELHDYQDNAFKINTDPMPNLDVDHRVLKYVRDATVANVKIPQEDDEFVTAEGDTDIRVSSLPVKQQEMYMRIQKKNEQRARRPTTDDEEDNLQIDEKWYSSDEERTEKNISSKPKSPPQNNYPAPYTPMQSDNEPTTVITKLGDLSKIDISAEVTKLLTSIKSTIPTDSTDSDGSLKKEQIKSRDPRQMPKKSPEHKPSTSDVLKKSTKAEFVSIYDCIEGGSKDGRRRADIDLRPTKDLDFRMPSFGDTDLRQTPGSGDVDLRLGLPFKAIPNYTPATEIDGSISSHPPINYKAHVIDIPRPDYTDIKNGTPRSQASVDPRLRKIFRLSLDESPSEPVEKPVKPTTARVDPRKRPKENETPAKPTPLDLQVVIQTSNWYKELSSNQKILVNQQLAIVTSNLKKFHQDTTVGKIFNLSEIKANNMLMMIFNNLGIILDEKGDFSQIKPQESTPNMPPNFNQNPDMFPGGNNMGMMDNMGMMGMNTMGQGNMGPMGNMSMMGPMGNYDPRYSSGDPRGAPGLLGIAPNIPHNNFDNGNFNGMQNNFNQDNFNGNFDNGMYNNGAGGNRNDFCNDNNYDDNFYRNQKNDYNNKPFRGGRGSDRWGRGSGRGGRDRRGFTERGNWKSDRR